MTLNEILIKKGQTSLHDKLLEKTVERVSLAKGDMGEPGHTPTDQELLALIKPLIPAPIPGKKGDKGDDGQDGHTPTADEILALIRPLIPKPKDGKAPTKSELIALIESVMPEPKDGSPDTGKEIVAKINDLPLDAKFKIDASHIKNLPKEKKAIHRGGNDVFVADLSASLNGSTKAFSIPVNNGVLLVISSSAPFIFKPVTDFTGSGTSTITFTPNVDAPSMLAASQYLFVLYK